MQNAASLRTIFTTTTALLTAVAIVVSGALVLLTTLLHRTTVSSAAAVENVLLAEEAEIDLLLHERAHDPILKLKIEGELRLKLERAAEFVSGSEEADALADARTKVDAYLTASRSQRNPGQVSTAQEAAYEALEELIALNLVQSITAQQDAAHWDSVGNALGIGVAILLIVVAGALLLWLRDRAFGPMFELASVMEDFGRGNRDARAIERGPRELREMCTRFNEMASAIASRRLAQIAFLGGVTHDLRSPLAVLQTSLALLESQRHELSDLEIRQLIGRMERQTTRMERLLSDFLDTARIEAGQFDLRFETRDLRRAFEDVVALFEGGAQGHSLAVRVPDFPLLVSCDHLRIEQVVTNLISNAIKYSPAETAIDVTMTVHPDEVEMSVTDHGDGISSEDLARIFEPFRRVGPSKENVPGAGLGLFVVRKIVDAHGGRIEVRSTPGKGSTFRVFLPFRSNRGRQATNARSHEAAA